MQKTATIEGVNLSDAIENACAELGLDRDSFSVEIIQKEKKGFLGLGAAPAKILVTFEAPDPAPRERTPAPPARRQDRPKRQPAPPAKAASPAKPEPSKGALTGQKQDPTKTRQAPAKATSPAKPKEALAGQKQDPVKTRQAPPKDEAKAANASAGAEVRSKPAGALGRPEGKRGAEGNPPPGTVLRPLANVEDVVNEPSEAEAVAIAFVNDLLAKMRINGEAKALRCEEENTICLNLVGDDMGTAIGRRGDTLDAMQYVTTQVLNKDKSLHCRVHIDTKNYRAKRQDSLERLAQKTAAKALKYRRTITLEPMKPYERRIIHATLQGAPGIQTHSTGNEPRRSVVICPAGAKGRGSRFPAQEKNPS